MAITKFKIWKETLILGPPYNATIDINIQYFASLNDPKNRYFQCCV
jgi:hypothetical protein